MFSFFKKHRNDSIHDNAAANSQPEPLAPLDELYLVAHRSQSPKFDAYKNQPPLFNLDINHPPLRVVLRRGSGTKSRPFGWCEQSGTQEPFILVLGEDRFKSTLERISMNDYRWKVEASRWALKGAIVDEEVTLVEHEKTFQWLRSSASGAPKGFANPDWKLIERTTGEPHAVYVERCTTWDGKADCGELQFRRSYGTEWELGVLVTIGVVVQKEMARKYKRATSQKELCIVWGIAGDNLN